VRISMSFLTCAAAVLVPFAVGLSGCGSTGDAEGHDSGSVDSPSDRATDALQRSDAGADAGSGKVTGSGGTLPVLYFAVAGDTRPPNEDDTAGYPTAIIQKIFEDIEAASPPIPFVVSTGDYQFASISGSESAPQLGLWLAARAKYSGLAFPAMGNHECTGATASNCGPGSKDGMTKNYSNFLGMMLSPIGQKLPYYSFNIDSLSPGAWTSKFIVVAGNAWDGAQSSWLSSTLAVKTTYTFVIRHEAPYADTAPGVTPSESIISSYPVTLEIFGHTHDYEWTSDNQVIIGNGGAPLSGHRDYGYGVVRQQTDGSLSVDMIDYQSGVADPSFHRMLTPTGGLAP
jgi:predicted phosphodiesterase